jgi:methionyl-tRNA synthetase
MQLAQEGNKYIDLKAPWKEVKEDKEMASKTLWIGANIISNLGVLISPFLPKTSVKISKLLSQNPAEQIWKYREIKPGTKLNSQGTLFKKIDIQEEMKKSL